MNWIKRLFIALYIGLFRQKELKQLKDEYIQLQEEYQELEEADLDNSKAREWRYKFRTWQDKGCKLYGYEQY